MRRIYFAGAAAQAPPGPGFTPWFVFDARHPEHVYQTGLIEPGYDAVGAVADAGGGPVSATASGNYVCLSPPDAQLGGLRPLYTVAGGKLTSSVPFPVAGAAERFFATVVKLDPGSLGNLLGYGSQVNGQLFDLLVQAGPRVGVHYFGNDPAAEGNALPFVAAAWTYISTRVTPSGSLIVRVNQQSSVEITGPTDTIAALLQLSAGGFAGLNQGGRKYFAYICAAVTPPSLVQEDALYADLASFVQQLPT